MENFTVFLRYGLVTLLLVCAQTGSAALAAPGPETVTQPVPAAASGSQAFAALLDEEWQYQLRTSPELATTIGDYRYNRFWTNYSLEQVSRDAMTSAEFLKRFQAVDPATLTEQEQISRAMMIRQLQDKLEGIRLKTYEMPIDQVQGVQLMLPGFVSSIPFDTAAQYQDYLVRLHALPTVLAQLRTLAQQGIKDGLVPPRYLLEKVVAQLEQVAAPAGVKNVFGQPVETFPKGISPAQQRKLQQVTLKVVDTEVRPAFAAFAQFVKTDYAPHGRKHEGIWSLPNGDAIYRYDIRAQTTSSMTPEEIHQLGLKQVNLIEGQMTTIAHKLGFADLTALRTSVDHDPKLYAHSREEILDRYRAAIAQMWPALPRIFNRIPKTRLEVRSVETYREADAAGAEYHQGTPDGSRPGIVFVNTGDYAKRDLYTIEDTAYHEGVPGHHFQISLAQDLPLPAFRQQGAYNSYIEGWALYAEGLGKELGFYQDLYSDYGRLNGALLRADRLVLDTGVHYKHWTRQQMSDFFHAHSPTSEPDMQAETDRYVAWPGQALGYMLGQQTILKLREHARTELGNKFDIKAFHDVILGNGAMPLDLMSERVESWIAKIRAS
ncbi:DUF885 domain-containing protein [Gluconobacter morbifer]|uniref:DUF885 domain-containing protein n=1 Tax=Gluconobacter morbifer G707 TaxID=1088869 RepID=G6XLA9_9PROT|nr:DUF885 family protein [Gluconobacter morbifer]EHH67537.1 hypothetical protein GMO_25320 [Gluconobacter morbifer G707]